MWEVKGAGTDVGVLCDATSARCSKGDEQLWIDQVHNRRASISIDMQPFLSVFEGRFVGSELEAHYVDLSAQLLLKWLQVRICVLSA